VGFVAQALYWKYSSVKNDAGEVGLILIKNYHFFWLLRQSTSNELTLAVFIIDC